MSDTTTKDAQDFAFYPERFIAGTAHMTAEERGAYIMLLCHQWLHDGVPDDPKRIASIARVRKVSEEVMSKFPKQEDGMLRNIRLEAIRTSQRDRINKAKKKSLDMHAARYKHCLEPAASSADSSPSAVLENCLITHNSLESVSARATGQKVQTILESYIRRDAPVQCMEAIHNAVALGSTLDEILAGTQKAAKLLKGRENNRFTPSARTFFEEQKWRSPEAYAWHQDRTQTNSKHGIQPHHGGSLNAPDRYAKK